MSRCVLKQRLLSGGSLAETNKTLPNSNEPQKTYTGQQWTSKDSYTGLRRNPKETARTKTARAGFHEGWGREEVLGVWISEAFPKNLVAVCHNSQSATLLSDSGLVMYFSTLPAPSSSAPCILAILTHLRGWSILQKFWAVLPGCFRRAEKGWRRQRWTPQKNTSELREFWRVL